MPGFGEVMKNKTCSTLNLTNNVNNLVSLVILVTEIYGDAYL